MDTIESNTTHSFMTAIASEKVFIIKKKSSIQKEILNFTHLIFSCTTSLFSGLSRSRITSSGFRLDAGTYGFA